MKEKLSLWEKLYAYHLRHQAMAVLILVGVALLSILVYCLPAIRGSALLREILLALFTSLMASVVAISVELYVSFRNAERDVIIEDIHTFGIDKMNRNKEDALRDMIRECEKEIWISGYRLIMTARLKDDVADAIRREGVCVRMLACPPWSAAYQVVYGSEPLMKNYAAILCALEEAAEDYRKAHPDDSGCAALELRFTPRPFFSDTYKVDQTFVTGPYMHNRDEDGNMLMAKDFFSYNIVRRSRLYRLVENEFETLWNDPGNQRVEDLAALADAVRGDMADEQLQEIFQKAASEA